MKKTNCIQLVLITAALAGCDRPLYQQGFGYPGSNVPGSNTPASAAAGSYDPYSPRPSYPPAGASASNTRQPDSQTPQPDSTNSCPLVDPQPPPDYYLWYSGLRPWDFFYDAWFNLGGHYARRHFATIVRAGFGRIANARFGGTGHS